jgi:hypothetical protein
MGEKRSVTNVLSMLGIPLCNLGWEPWHAGKYVRTLLQARHEPWSADD